MFPAVHCGRTFLQAGFSALWTLIGGMKTIKLCSKGVLTPFEPMERCLRPRPHVQLFMRCTNFGRPVLSQVRLMDHSLKDNEASNQSDNLLSRVSDGWKISYDNIFGF